MAQSADAVPSKGTVLRDVWVRVPPAASSKARQTWRFGAGSGLRRSSRHANELVDARVRGGVVARAPDSAIELSDGDPGVTRRRDGGARAARRGSGRCRNGRLGAYPARLSALGAHRSALAAQHVGEGDREDRHSHGDAAQYEWAHPRSDAGQVLPDRRTSGPWGDGYGHPSPVRGFIDGFRIVFPPRPRHGVEYRADCGMGGGACAMRSLELALCGRWTCAMRSQGLPCGDRAGCSRACEPPRWGPPARRSSPGRTRSARTG